MSRKDKQQHHKKEKVKVLNKKLLFALGFIIAFLAIVLYANTYGHDYALDDYSVIKENWVVKKGVDGIPILLKTHYRYGYWSSQGVMYRPLSLIMFAIEWNIAPNTPSLSHFMNIFLYGICGLLLFFTLSKMLKSYHLIIPFVACLLFMAHPLHTEVIANIKSRDEILSFLFAILSINLIWDYLKSNSKLKLVLALASFFLAFLSKENTITYIIIIPLAIFFFTDTPLRKTVIVSSLFLIPTFLYLGIRYSILGNFQNDEAISVTDNLLQMAQHDFIKRTATAFAIMWKYLLLLFYPHPLTSDNSYNQIPLINYADYKAILAVLCYLGMFVYAILRFKKKSLISFGILFFLISFSLYSNLFLIIGSCYGERFLFVPSLGFTLIIAFLIAKLFKIDAPDESLFGSASDFFKNNAKIIGITLVVFSLYSFQTIRRNKEWKDNYTLYSTDVKTATNSTRIHYHYGLSTMKDKALTAKTSEEKEHYLDIAIGEFKTAARIYPHFVDIYDQLGLAYYRKKQLDSAMYYYDIAIKKSPGKARPYCNVGIIYFEKQMYDKALEVYLTAVKLDPRYADAYMNLGSTYGTLGKFQQSIENFRKCIEFDPDNAQATYFLGFTYKQIGDLVNAEKYMNQAYRMDPSLKK